jgi:isocitrate dehydrogenase
MSNDINGKDIFISYNWNIKDQVKKLYENLKSLGYNVWLDDKNLETSNNALTVQLASAIKNSKLFICCVTTDYCKSNNCNREIEYADSSAKPIIPLMIEKISPTNIEEIQITGRNQFSGIGFIIW